MRMIWLIVPSLAIAAPFVWRSVKSGDGWWMLADPGVTWAGAQVAADEQGRALLAFGMPTPDMAGWASMLSDGPLWWVPLLAAPLALVALAAPLTRRWAAGVMLLGVAALGPDQRPPSPGVASLAMPSPGADTVPTTNSVLSGVAGSSSSRSTTCPRR